MNVPFLMLIILSLLPGTPPPDPGTMSGTDGTLSWQASPGLVPVSIAANSGAIFGEESLLRQKFAFFMQANNSSNVTFYVLPNLTMESG